MTTLESLFQKSLHAEMRRSSVEELQTVHKALGTKYISPLERIASKSREVYITCHWPAGS